MTEIPGAAETLAQVVDVFSCCLFTWKALVTVLPAFLLAGAVAAFLPAPLVLRYLGAGANKLVAYLVASVSGIVLSLCSCNVVPLFLSIYRSGAGIGPASAFLYAGPAINIVSMVLVFDAIGWQMGLWRALLVPVVAVACGLAMAALFGRQDGRLAPGAQVYALQTTSPGQLVGLFALLTAMVIFGAWETDPLWKAAGMLGIVGAGVLMFVLLFTAEDARAWGRETWHLVKLVIPVLIPAVLLIGLATVYVDIKWVYRHVGDNSAGSIVFADLFGELMYFPILSEVVFAKAMLKLGMAPGPAMAILLTGTGASLPGALIIGRGIGWGKAAVYIGCEIVFSTLAAMLFASEVARYICECMMNL